MPNPQELILEGNEADVALDAGWKAVHGLYDFEKLQVLYNQIEECSRKFPDHQGFYLLRAAVLQQQFRWAEASDVLSIGSARYPQCIEMLYEGALLSIDGSYYGRAKQFMHQISPYLTSLSSRQLRGVFRGCGLLGLHDIALQCLDIAHGENAGVFSTEVRKRTLSALRNADSLKGVRVVSLGENCFPWMVLNRWGLRADPASQENDTVFNLAQTSTDGCASVLEHLGEYDLIEPASLRIFINSNGGPLARNIKHSMDFNHEQGYAWMESGFEKLRQRYMTRIACLRATFQGAPRVFVHYTENAGGIERLSAAVEAVNEDRNFRLVIIDAEGRDIITQSDRLQYLSIKKPRSDYLWFRPDDFDSAEGVGFEERAIVPVLQAIRELSADTSRSALIASDPS